MDEKTNQRINCPVCENKTYEPVENDSGVEYGKCRNCKSKYMLYPDSPAKIEKFYERRYKGYYKLKKRVLLMIPYSRHYKRNLDFLSGLPHGSMLDVGCSEGKFMWLMKRRGWKVEGVEPSGCHTYAKSLYKHDVFHGTIGEFNNKKKFDLITCAGVLEHVPYMRKFINEIKPHLKNDGKLFISVPYAEHAYHSSHLILFSLYGLTMLMDELGFEIERAVQDKYDILLLSKI